VFLPNGPAVESRPSPGHHVKYWRQFYQLRSHNQSINE